MIKIVLLLVLFYSSNRLLHGKYLLIKLTEKGNQWNRETTNTNIYFQPIQTCVFNQYKHLFSTNTNIYFSTKFSPLIHLL
jgi:hypothetical protein